MTINRAARQTAASEWRSHWAIPAVSAIGLAIAFSHVYIIGVLMAPIQRETHWSRSTIASGLTILSIFGVVLAPFTGWLIDRVGSRRIALPGLALYCAALGLLALAGGSTAIWWLMWSILGLGSVFVKPTVWAAAIVSRFDRGRGLAMGVAMCGSGVGGAVLPLITTLLVDRYGWREAIALLALGEALISLPPVIILFRDPPNRKQTSTARSRSPGFAGPPLKTLLRGRIFIQLAIATLVFTTATLSMQIHFVPIVSARGLSRELAASLAGLIGASMITGRLVTGFILDRAPAQLVSALTFALPTMVCGMLFLHTRDPLSLGAAALLLGLSLGAEVDAVVYLASRHFGIERFGILYGSLNGLVTLGTGLGPLLGGYIYDRFGGYDPLFVILAPCFVISALLVGSLGAYPSADTTPLPDVDAERLAIDPV
jgi:MFS family permease